MFYKNGYKKPLKKVDMQIQWNGFPINFNKKKRLNKKLFRNQTYAGTTLKIYSFLYYYTLRLKTYYFKLN